MLPVGKKYVAGERGIDYRRCCGDRKSRETCAIPRDSGGHVIGRDLMTKGGAVGRQADREVARSDRWGDCFEATYSSPWTSLPGRDVELAALKADRSVPG